MTVRVRGGDIVFNDGSTQSTAAATPSTDFGVVGTYAILMHAVNSDLAQGATIAGSSLRHSLTGITPFGAVTRNIYGTYPGGGIAPSGTWRKMSYGFSYQTSPYDSYGNLIYYWLPSLFVRIS
jgi:hypothetical protein